MFVKLTAQFEKMADELIMLKRDVEEIDIDPKNVKKSFGMFPGGQVTKTLNLVWMCLQTLQPSKGLRIGLQIR